MKKFLFLPLVLLAMTIFSCGGSGPKSVYVSGIRFASGSISMVPVYWKDGVMTDLKASGNAIANTIFVKDADIYVAGMCLAGSGSTACYWKNGTQKILTTSGITEALVYDIFVDDDNNVYLAGICDKGAESIACYWKNDTVVELTDGTLDSAVRSMFVDSDGNVYLGGTTGDVGGYWVNDSSHFTQLTADGIINSIYVKDGVVYTSGSNNAGSFDQATYWTNTTKTALTDGTTEDAVAPAIGLSETAIYINGLEGPNYTEPVYWKGTAASKKALSLGSYFIADGVPYFPLALDGEDVYVAATVATTDGGSDYTPVYWKNGVMQVLKMGTSSRAVPTDITVK